VNSSGWIDYTIYIEAREQGVDMNMDRIGATRLITTIAVFGFMLVSIELAPVAPSGWGPIGFGVSPAMASGLVCDCSTADKAKADDDKAKADADKAKADDDQAEAVADKAEADDDQAKADADAAQKAYDDNPTNANQQVLDDADQAKADADQAKADADQAKADADKTKADADKTKADADKTKEDADKNVVGAPCSCGNGTTGYWTNATGGTSTPPGGSAPKAERQIHGQ